VKRGSLAKADSELTGWELASNKKLYFDEVYNKLFVQPIEWIGKMSHQVIEVAVLNKSISVFTTAVGKTGDLVRKWQTGYVSNYLLWMVLGIVGLVVYYLLKF
jgi:NADH-quinone oxidoreductase subunit L